MGRSWEHKAVTCDRRSPTAEAHATLVAGLRIGPGELKQNKRAWFGNNVDVDWPRWNQQMQDVQMLQDPVACMRARKAAPDDVAVEPATGRLVPGPDNQGCRIGVAGAAVQLGPRWMLLKKQDSLVGQRNGTAIWLHSHECWGIWGLGVATETSSWQTTNNVNALFMTPRTWSKDEPQPFRSLQEY